MLVSSCLIPIAGRLADDLGRKKVIKPIVTFVLTRDYSDVDGRLVDKLVQPNIFGTLTDSSSPHC